MTKLTPAKMRARTKRIAGTKAERLAKATRIAGRTPTPVTGYRGVRFDEHESKKFMATALSVHLGYFDDKHVAATEWDRSISRMLGKDVVSECAKQDIPLLNAMLYPKRKALQK